MKQQIWRKKMPTKVKTIKLNLADAQSVLWTIRQRQDDCRRVKHDMPAYETYRTLDCKLEALKMKIVKQMG